MDTLESVFPQSLEYNDPKKAIMSARRTVSVKPLSGNKLTGASTSDRIQIRLPNVGCLESCYLKCKLKPTLSSGSDKAVVDPYAGSASWMREVVLRSSDGSTVSQTNQYNRYCSLMNRFCVAKDVAENQMSLTDRCPAENDDEDDGFGANAEAVADGGAEDTLAIKKHAGAESANKRKSTEMASATEYTFCHEFVDNILDNSRDYKLPLFAMGSGMLLEITPESGNNVFRLVSNSAVTGSVNRYARAPNGSLSSYDILDIELVCDIIFLESGTNQGISEQICDGLRFAVPHVRHQVASINATEQTVILSSQGRSVDAIFAGLRNTGDSGSVQYDNASYYEAPDGTHTNNLARYQASVGSESTPSFAVPFGAQSFQELKKAMKSINKNANHGGQVSLRQYTKDDDDSGDNNRTLAVRKSSAFDSMPGSSVIGIGLRTHPRLASDILAGRTASSGSIPLSLDLTFNAQPSNAEMDVFTYSTQVVEVLADGGILISR